MTPKERSKGISEAGYTQKLIAKITGFSLTNVNSVIYEREGNQSRNPIIRAAIAIILRRPVDEVFNDHVQYYCKIYSILAKPDGIVNGKP